MDFDCSCCCCCSSAAVLITGAFIAALCAGALVWRTGFRPRPMISQRYPQPS